MTHHRRRFARAGALAWLVLAAGLLSLPASASQLADDLPGTIIAPDPPEGTDPAPSTADPTAIGPPESTPLPPDPTAATIPPSTEPDPEEATATGMAEVTDDLATSALETSTATPDSSSSTPTLTQTSAPPTPTDESSWSTDAPSPTPTVSDTSTVEIPTSTLTATTSSGLSATPTVTFSATLTETPTATPAGPVDSPATFDVGAILINEVAWAGTLASTSDEWIELWNPGPSAISLDGWTLTDGGDITVVLVGEVAALDFYLLERSDDQTVSDVAADRIYTGSLNNGGETIELIDPSATRIDTANAAGGAWPAGNTSARASMERHGVLDVSASWTTFPGFGGNGLDADGNPIPGTPRQPNAPNVPPATSTPSPTPTGASPPPTPFPAEAVIINEVAWAGTLASTSDEWIELLNPGQSAIQLDGWRLTDDGDIDVELGGLLAGGAYYVLERGDDQTISDQTAERLYSGALSNEGERLRLIDPSGTEIDVVNPSGGGWPAGNTSERASMERTHGVWRTFSGFYGLGLDADGQAIHGTPHGPNSVSLPTPLPTWIPGRVVVNEVLIRPRHDWEGAGGVTTDDEFIELLNRGPGPVNLAGWTLDDVLEGGSSPYSLPAITLGAGEFAALFRTRTGLALNDSGDSVRLSAPDGRLIDKVRYLRVRAANLAYGRLPDGDDVLVYGLWPTPGTANRLYVPPSFPVGAILINEVAWAGTAASASDEWIELWNPGTMAIHLDGWVLTDEEDIRIDLVGLVPAGGFALLERSNDETVADFPAHSVYTGALADAGEVLRLLDPSGKEIDVVNRVAGEWPAGDSRSRLTMERVGDDWRDFAGDTGRRLDASGQAILGTPGRVNSELAAMAVAESLTCDRAGRVQGVCP